MPSDFRLYPLALPESETGTTAGSSNPLEGRITALETLVRQGAVRSRKSLRDALALSGIPDMRGRLQALSVSGGNGGGSPSPSPEPTGDVAATIAAVKARLPLAQYSQSKIAAIEAFVTALWNGGVWQKLHRFHCFVSPTSVAALVDWVGGVGLTPVGNYITLTPWQSINLNFTTGYSFGALSSPEGSTMPGYSPLNSSMFFKGKAGGLIDGYALNEDNYLNDRDYGLVGVFDGTYSVDKTRLFYRKISATSATYSIDTVWSQGSTVEEDSKAFAIGSTQSGAIAFVSNRSGQSTGLVASGSSSQSLTFQPLTESMLAMPRGQLFIGPVPSFSGISYQCVAIGQSLTQQQSALLISASNTLCTAMEG